MINSTNNELSSPQLNRIHQVDQIEQSRLSKVAKVVGYIFMAAVVAGVLVAAHMPLAMIIAGTISVVAISYGFQKLDRYCTQICREEHELRQIAPNVTEDVSVLTLSPNQVVPLLNDMIDGMREESKKTKEITGESGSATILQIINDDLIERYAREHSLEVYDENQKLLFNSRIENKEDRKANVVRFCNGVDQNLRNQSLVFSTQAVGNAFYRRGVPLRITNGIYQHADLLNIWGASAKKTHAKITLTDLGLKIDELTFEMIIPQQAHVNLQTGNRVGVGRLMVIKMVLKDIVISMSDWSNSFEFKDNYTATLAITSKMNPTLEESRQIERFYQLANTELPEESEEDPIAILSQPAVPSTDEHALSAANDQEGVSIDLPSPSSDKVEESNGVVLTSDDPILKNVNQVSTVVKSLPYLWNPVFFITGFTHSHIRKKWF